MGKKNQRDPRLQAKLKGSIRYNPLIALYRSSKPRVRQKTKETPGFSNAEKGEFTTPRNGEVDDELQYVGTEMNIEDESPDDLDLEAWQDLDNLEADSAEEWPADDEESPLESVRGRLRELACRLLRVSLQYQSYYWVHLHFH